MLVQVNCKYNDKYFKILKFKCSSLLNIKITAFDYVRKLTTMKKLKEWDQEYELSQAQVELYVCLKYVLI